MTFNENFEKSKKLFDSDKLLGTHYDIQRAFTKEKD